MAKYLKEEMLTRVLRNKFSTNAGLKVDIEDLKDAIHNTPKVDAIPVSFISDFAKTHDPVYQSNLASLIRAYNHEVDDRDRIPDDLFEC